MLIVGIFAWLTLVEAVEGSVDGFTCGVGVEAGAGGSDL